MTTSIERFRRSHPILFWAYGATCVLILAVVMFVFADRATQPTTSFEPASGAAEPENEFLPTDRAVSDCISAIPKPGCGSDARGGWRQALVLLAIVVGLALIAWRVVANARKAKRRQPTAT